MGLHWFDITLDTPVRDIGWVYVVLVLALVLLAYFVRRLWEDWK